MTYKRHHHECFPEASRDPETKYSNDATRRQSKAEGKDFDKAFMYDRMSLHESVSIELNEPPQKRKCNDFPENPYPKPAFEAQPHQQQVCRCGCMSGFMPH